MTAISLFTSGGIGDLAVRGAGFHILLSNELLPDRHQLVRHNFPTTHCISGDVWEKSPEIVQQTRALLAGRELDLLYATPPCQGMSKNGRGKLLSAIRSGKKPPLDPRNRLIVPTLEIARALQPRLLVLENVPEMATTLIEDGPDTLIPVLDYIARELGPNYVGCGEVVEFADYGVPQCRQRLITVYTRDENLKAHFAARGTFLPDRTHAQKPDARKLPWLTVRHALAGVPPLDAATKSSARSDIPFHRVPLLDAAKYWWVSNTPSEKSAFDNQCTACGHQANPVHSALRDQDGIKHASVTTPIHCRACGALLPRPAVREGNAWRLMKGFGSAYKRMSFDKPASALTSNLSFACSDNKIHPVEHRVLSLYEAFRLHGLDAYPYEWKRADGHRVGDSLIRDVLGESIPPAGFEVILQHLARQLQPQRT